MSVFFPDLLDGFLKSDFLEKVREKYHYGEGQMDELKAVAEEMLPYIAGDAFWERKGWHVPPAQNSLSVKGRQEEGNNKILDRRWEAVVISLGWRVDELQESYSQKGMLSECYMLEGLASELLLDSYREYNQYMQEHTDWHVARYHFLGSEGEFPLEMLPGILEDIASQLEEQEAGYDVQGIAGGNLHRIICNSSFCIQPKKSVVFIAELTKEEAAHCPGICLGCSSIHCPNRMEEELVRR